MSAALEKVREALEARGSRIQSQGSDRFTAQCPSHPDKNPSLSVRQGDRAALLRCFAGCETEQVVQDLGLTLRDLFDVSEITYDYRDLSGNVSRTVVRKPDKRYLQRGPHTKGTSILYRLTEVVEAVKSGTPVYVAEGEKDVHHLEAAGVVATCTAGGASNAKHADLSPLEGAEVRIVPDRDNAGEKYAETLWESLSGFASSVTFWKVPEGKDFSDSWTAGFGVEDLEEFVPDFAKDSGEKQEERWVILKRFSDYEPLPVEWLWDQRIPLDMTTMLAGREGLGKSTFALWIAAQVTKGTLNGDLEGPRNVLWVSSEEDFEKTLIPRAIAAGADTSRLDYLIMGTLAGEDSLDLPRDAGRLEAVAKQQRAALIVLDPINSFLSDKVDSHKDHMLRQALDPLRRVAANAGCALLALHHLNKSGRGDLGDRMLGARTYAASARSVIGFTSDPDDKDGPKRFVSLAKANLSDRSHVPNLSVVLENRTVDTKVGPMDVGAARITGEDSRTLSEVLDALDRLAIPEKDDHDEEVEWLHDYLMACEGSARYPEILKAARKEGYSETSLKRAGRKLKVQKKRQGFGGGSFWILQEFDVQPEPEETSTETATPATSEVVDFPVQAVLEETARTCRVRNCEEPEFLDVRLGGLSWGVCEVHQSHELAIRSRGDGLEVIA